MRKKAQRKVPVPAVSSPRFTSRSRLGGPAPSIELPPRAVLRHEIEHADAGDDFNRRCPECGRGPQVSHWNCREYEPERDKYGL